MGTYYHLYNDTKKHEVHLDNHIKKGPIKHNSAVHFAIINYMYENLGDDLQMNPDSSWSSDDSYQDIDLLKYKFEDKDVMPVIVEKLNTCYKREKYIVVDGMGIDTDGEK